MKKLQAFTSFGPLNVKVQMAENAKFRSVRYLTTQAIRNQLSDETELFSAMFCYRELKKVMISTLTHGYGGGSKRRSEQLSFLMDKIGGRPVKMGMFANLVGDLQMRTMLIRSTLQPSLDTPQMTDDTLSAGCTLWYAFRLMRDCPAIFRSSNLTQNPEVVNIMDVIHAWKLLGWCWRMLANTERQSNRPQDTPATEPILHVDDVVEEVHPDTEGLNLLEGQSLTSARIGHVTVEEAEACTIDPAIFLGVSDAVASSLAADTRTGATGEYRAPPGATGTYIRQGD
ncbi:hypothetical protein AbraCBS73388_002796 [Aspergillus brasiliensis]|uniref:Uncharacterized protein n=1 Tax=Aspergillus brasiliensis TaxID=319629 RepID=A0A9W5Z106_9EURO|nr:hypothetical protein AbraCBS73388_002796 [Aspergillus brasiliensis]